MILKAEVIDSFEITSIGIIVVLKFSNESKGLKREQILASQFSGLKWKVIYRIQHSHYIIS